MSEKPEELRHDDPRIEHYRANGFVGNIDFDKLSNGEKLVFFEAKSPMTWGCSRNGEKIPMVQLKGFLLDTGEVIIVEAKSAYSKDWKEIEHLFKEGK